MDGIKTNEGAATQGGAPSELELKQNELAKLSTDIAAGYEELEELQAELSKLKEEIEYNKTNLKALANTSLNTESDIDEDIEDIKIVYKSFSLDGKKYNRVDLEAALSEGDEKAFALIKKLVSLKSGAIEIIKKKN